MLLECRRRGWGESVGCIDTFGLVACGGSWVDDQNLPQGIAIERVRVRLAGTVDELGFRG